MKKLLYLFIASLVIFTVSSCEDYLEVTSPSVVDEDFVFTNSSECTKVMMGAYEMLRATSTTYLYDISMVGSDAECHPEAYSAQQRHIPEGLYASEISINNYAGIWANYYGIANRANIIIAQIETKPDFKKDWDAGKPTVWTQLYGEAVCLRALIYHELVRYWGDIPHFKEPIYTKVIADSAVCSTRDEIWDFQIAELRRVEPLMFRLGEGGATAERFSRTFAQGLIARLALDAGGFSLRRTDFNYGDVTFESGGFAEKWNAKYVRRTDYKKYYEIAKEYLQSCIDNPGSAQLITNDERGYNNPFQRHFQYMMDLAVSPESMYEIPNSQGGASNSEFGYAFSRPSDGGGSNAFPCKAYGQSRFYPVFYYGDFDPADLRRDATVSVTGNSGKCVEVIVTFKPGSRNNGGLPTNKWDESRMSNPYTVKQRKSGINQPYMRMADAILLLAEVKAELGDEGGAKAELTKVRSRAFLAADQDTKVTAYVNGLSGEALKEAIQQERKLELAGEGIRRWDLIRTGKFADKIKEVRDRQKQMFEGLKANGYYTFPNGNTISNYIYTKSVNTADLGMSYMLTKQCDVTRTDPTYPVKFPSWRGQHDGWEGMTNAEGNRNLAIVGMFRFVEPTGAEALALEAAGYKKTDWASDIVANESQYVLDVFKGYPDDFHAQKAPPRYLIPFSAETVSKSNGLITNGYGFSQE